MAHGIAHEAPRDLPRHVWQEREKSLFYRGCGQVEGKLVRLVVTYEVYCNLELRGTVRYARYI